MAACRTLRRPPGRPSVHQRGLSLVEMMVGIAVGLFVVSGAVFVVATQLGDNRRLLLETQLQQDLRATSDIITRELRRAGGRYENTFFNVWVPGAAASPNSYDDVTIDETGPQITFSYRRIQQEVDGGFKRDGNVIKSLIGGNWQDLTDATTMAVTEFDVQSDTSTEVVPCPRACSADLTDTACWPTVSVRSFVVTIGVSAVSDPNVQRSMRSEVRLRNDEVSFNDATSPTRACPP